MTMFTARGKRRRRVRYLFGLPALVVVLGVSAMAMPRCGRAPAAAAPTAKPVRAPLVPTAAVPRAADVITTASVKLFNTTGATNNWQSF